jgi:hypothetical protein
MKELEKNDKNEKEFFEYTKPGWSFHSKGIWFEE